MQDSLSKAKRIVVKVGSTLLVDSQRCCRREWLSCFLADVARCAKRGQDVVIVSSGAIALGASGLKKPPKSLEEYQAAAAVGQIQLANAYQSELSSHGLNIAQILLTLDDSEDRKRYLNARNTIATLLNNKIIPIINENDTVATTEICYGDNDRLAARVAQMIDADILILLSDIDGLYTADPKTQADATFIPTVNEIDERILSMAGLSSTDYGSGGMQTKLAAATIAMSNGTKMVITKGDVSDPILGLENGAQCTWFLPQSTPKQARKKWLQHHLHTSGALVVDSGAAHALRHGSSLLAAGVVAVEGEFGKGSCVKINSVQGQTLAHGLCNYSSSDTQKILKTHSANIPSILGYKGSDEVIHRNDLALLAMNGSDHV